MALSDEDVGLAPSSPSRGSEGPPGGWKIDPAVQRQRDAEADRILQAEKQPGGGGLIRTSSVIPGSKATPEGASFLSDEDVGLGAPAKPKIASFVNPVAEGEERRGYYANIKNPLELMENESFIANMRAAYERGTFGEILGRMRAAEQGPSRKRQIEGNEGGAAVGMRSSRRQTITPSTKPTFQEMYAEAKKDPGKFVAELRNSIVADPYLLAAPLGAGGRIAGKSVGGRMLEAGMVGGGTNAAIEGGKQTAKGEFSGEEIEKAMLMGGAMSAPFGAVFGRSGRRASDAAAPRVEPSLAQSRLEGPRPEVIPPEPRPTLGRRAGDTFEGEWSRVVEEVEPIAAKAPETRSPPETAKLLDFSKRWAQENKLSLGAAAALTTYTMFGEDPENGIIGLAMLGAMRGPKPKGGMWHPKAAETIANPLQEAFRGSEIDRVRGLPPEGLAAYRAELQRQRDANPDPLEQQIYNQRLGELDTAGWAQKASKNYLNKFMGTADDPLKDIEIPFGEGTKKWGEISDALLTNRPVNQLVGKGVPAEDAVFGPAFAKNPDEPVWNIDPRKEQTFAIQGRGEIPLRMEGSVSEPARALKSYLSHVGDYLRQNVPPEKLQQYDLVRAVKETAKNDERMAKLAEKEAGDAGKDLPVVKEYPDGFRWVELKKPEKLTEEQKGRVAKAEDLGLFPDPDRPYAARGADGKFIENSYTGEAAFGRTPEEAYLAGQLAREGNSMGHCVGGYCEDVASGKSRIYSLRSPKGTSHVTIEVSPPHADAKPESVARVFLAAADERALANVEDKVGPKPGQKGSYAEPIYTSVDKWYKAITETEEFKEWLKTEPPDIVQIKGKGNKAPIKDYLPYVQDFVKSGKWDYVGDLENTGLTSLDQIGEAEARIAKELFPKDRLLDDKQISSIKEIVTEAFTDESVPPGNLASRVDFVLRRKKETGSIDPIGSMARGPGGRQVGAGNQDMMTALAALGIGAATGAALFGEDSPFLAPLAGALTAAGLGTAAGRAAGRKIISRAAEEADELAGLVSTRIQNISPRLHHQLLNFERRSLTRTYETMEKVAPLMHGLKNLKGKFDGEIIANTPLRVRAAMRQAGLEKEWDTTRKILNDLGVKDYFPRIVKDMDGLMDHLTEDQSARVTKALEAADKVSKAKLNRPLNDLEKSSIINRELKDADKEMAKFFLPPQEALLRTVGEAVKEAEMTLLFGKNGVRIDRAGRLHLNLEASVGNMVGETVAKEKLSHKQRKELEGMLLSRFGPAERAMPGWQQDFRNVTNAMLLGNPLSAAIQLGDAFTAAYHHGMVSTVVGVVSALGKKPVSAKELGLMGHIAQEFDGSPRATTKLLDWAFKWGGFTAIDRFGKNVNLNAAHHKLRRQAQTPQGRAKLEEVYGKAYGDDFDQLISDLKSGTKSEHTQAALFHELSRAQPLTKLETAQTHMNSPNWRLTYQLKSFMLKQFDLARRDIYNEARKGNYTRALTNSMKLAAAFGLANMSSQAVKDFLAGQDVEISDEQLVEGFLKNYGMGEYIRDKAKQGKVDEVVGSFIVPPYRIFNDILKEDPKAVRYIPVVGQLLYHHGLGGAEKERERREKKKEREE